MKHTAGRTFPEDFLWGVAAASYQVEGAAEADGRGVSIWDTFSRTPGKVRHGHTGDVSVDQYHRYPEDVALMRELGVPAYRFSIAWPRVQPAGSGAINPAGLDYYRRLADALHQGGIQAVATLYHWDLPQPLQDSRGWTARDTAERFADYSSVCFDALKDHVDMWITLNEPWCSSILGYLEGEHAPGHRNRTEAWAAGHHLMLAHGLAMQRYRGGIGSAGVAGGAAPIGITLNMESPRPATRRPEDSEAVDRQMDMRSRFFLNPLLGRAYPERHFVAYPQETPPPVRDGDVAIIATAMDFLGLNYYHEPAIAADSRHVEGFREVPGHHEKTAMGWPITPRGLYRHLHWVWQETEGRYPLYITENGCAMDDCLTPDGLQCHDPHRVAYLREHFAAARDAMDDGVDLRGYFVWSLIDNFEWAYGYDKRFGIIYADYVNQRRVPKDSYHYLREVISGAEVF